MGSQILPQVIVWGWRPLVDAFVPALSLHPELENAAVISHSFSDDCDLLQILEHHPKAKVVCVLADPRNIVTEFLTKHAELEAACADVRAVFETLQKATAQYGRRLFVLTGEKLIREPEPELEQVLRFLRIANDKHSVYALIQASSLMSKLAPLWGVFRRELPRESWTQVLEKVGPLPQALQPIVSILLPVHDPLPRYLLEALNSIEAQSYPLWEVCLVDDGSANPRVREILDGFARHPYVHLTRHPTAQGTSAATNSAADMAGGLFQTFVDHDDILEPFALESLVEAAVECGADLLYSDERVYVESSKQFIPYLKPRYSPDLLLSHNYFCHLVCVRWDLMKQVGRFRSEFDGAQDYDFVLRAAEKAKQITHVAKSLYTWRHHLANISAHMNTDTVLWSRTMAAVEEALARRKIDAQTLPGDMPNTVRVKRKILGRPLVSVLIPFRDRPELLKECVRTVREKTDYPNYEILALDNGSRLPETKELLHHLQKEMGEQLRVFDLDFPFNYSLLNNFGAMQARGSHLLFLNNDTEVISPEWMSAMLEHSQRPEVGAVGARLLFPEGTIQHAGVVIGMGGLAGHQFSGLPGHASGYLHKVRSIHNLSAVTGACMMMPREYFLTLGGFNATELKDEFTDVELCLRVRESGRLIVYTPYALLTHFESASRGKDDSPHRVVARNFVRHRHKFIFDQGDPYYSPGLSLNHDHVPMEVLTLRHGHCPPERPEI